MPRILKTAGLLLLGALVLLGLLLLFFDREGEADAISLGEIPPYTGSASCVLNGNVPLFSPSDRTAVSFEKYEALDALGRCGPCMACVGRDLMPTEERGEIGQIRPSGWHTVKYDFIEKKYLYNRCHLLGYQLTGENANTENLITGTRYLNTEGMLPYENEVASYVRRTGNHVLYRVTPVFGGGDLVASGVTMEAESVEDRGAGVRFYVYCYNVQPGVVIDYATGESWENPAAKGEEPARSLETAPSSTYSESPAVTVENRPPVEIPGDTDYVLNTRSMKFHLPACDSVEQMSEKNRQFYAGTREALLEEGYAPCGACRP